MGDPSKIVTKQEITITSSAKDRGKSVKKKTEEDRDSVQFSSLHKQGVDKLTRAGFVVEVKEGGDHCNHEICVPMEFREIKGMNVPDRFKPLVPLHCADQLGSIASLFDGSSQELKNFWAPLFNPKPGESDLMTTTHRIIKMNNSQSEREFSAEVRMGHTFDPDNKLASRNKTPPNNPRIWVPAREWFSESVRRVKFGDVFTIFPKAERELLKLLLGRIGVGQSNHIPEGWGDKDSIKHTARMAAVIVGKDPGLGKSTLFNGMIAAFSKCGFKSQTFKSTEDRFGMKAVALCDIAYKDDTSLATLKKFLSSEDTKVMITNGRFQVEDKFQSREQVMPRCVFLVNSNDWESKFAYDLDPGIIDRIKIISTYRKHELDYIRGILNESSVSAGSPDLRPSAHLPWLADKLDVSIDVLYLWCLRLCTDEFWKIISDTSDPTINKLETEVRFWTTRLRIRFKSDVIQALVNSLAFSWALRTGNTEIPELNPYILKECLDCFYFLGVDPSAQQLTELMKNRWDLARRPTTHYYQGFREVRWESVRKARDVAIEQTSGEEGSSARYTFSEFVKEVVEKIDLRDGFKIGGTASYVIDSWETMRYGKMELIEEAQSLLSEIDPKFLGRIKNTNLICHDKWLENKRYSPDGAEKLRLNAVADMYKDGEGKVLKE